MTINIICETTPGFSFHYKKLAESVIEHSLETEGFPYEAEVNLTLVDEERIHEINLDMRQIDAPTDVLSFPMIAYEYPADFDGVDDQLDDCVNPDTGEVLLGDIVICVPRVYQQAEEYGHSVKREYAFLITHSMLHLMGYDHMVPEEAQLMEAHQRKILDTMGITR
ncbi:rRNA maturation RNase YbeY [uncultured Eubacterium sp.]|uniref:rRNA maturation RNase YbeY n=1 Tax=uncultured Eubacterium sp. TaxID=165185 RepID=UPI0025F82677|nr:rRNA maturation RNase YbeY [uncultured Eubacterium sp.]